MTSYPVHSLPSPISPEVFEDLCCDLWRLLWRDPGAQKHGRRGQRQRGVDIYGKRDGSWEAVQCKHKDPIGSKKLTSSLVEKEVGQARTFDPPLRRLTVATTAARDVDLQAAVRRLSDANEKDGSFSVSIAFWDDIVADVRRYPDLLGKYYPDFIKVRKKKKRYRWMVVLVAGLIFLCGVGLAIRSWYVRSVVAEGVAHFEHQHWAEARNRFRVALKLDSGSAEILSNLAATEERLGETRAAEGHYREALQLCPSSAEHLFNLGFFLNGQERFADAYPFLVQAVEGEPARVDAFGELARAALALGLLDRAREALSTGLRLDPDRAPLHRLYGELELRRGQPENAIPHFESARDRYALGDRGLVETSWLLIQAYDRLGNAPALCRAFDEFRRLDEPGITPWAPEAEEVAARHNCPTK